MEFLISKILNKMKKIIFGVMMLLGGFAFAQNYPDYYPNQGNYDNGYYSDSDDEYYFPEDYYYDYPADYYSDDFYSGYYNDYRRSISDVNWNRFFVENNLSPWQIQQIIYLNQMYPTFASWNNYYRYNPDRWYYDRFYAIQQILGPRVFVTFQNVYYGGYSPFVYYRNYRISHYRPIVYITPRYRSVNINIYRIDKHKYHQNYGWSYNSREGIGFKNTPRTGSSGNWNNSGNNGFRSSGGFRNQVPQTNNAPRFENNSGTRGNSGGSFRGNSGNSRSEGNNGFRKSSGSERVQQQEKSNERKSNSYRASGQRLVSR